MQRKPVLRSGKTGPILEVRPGGPMDIADDPDSAEVKPVGKLKKLGNFIFVGNDLYLTGTTQLRRIRDVAERR